MAPSPFGTFRTTQINQQATRFDLGFSILHNWAVIKPWVMENSSRFWRAWWVVLAGIAILTLISLFFVDQRFAQFFGAEDMVQVWLFHRRITEIGAAEFYFAIAILGLLIKPVRRRATFLLVCLLSSGFFLHIFKFLVGRCRPHKAPENNPLLFDPFNFHHHWQSFPSGHSQTLFSFATVLAFLFPRTAPWIFVVALYLAMTRAFTLAHFVSDVFAGAAVGVLVSVLTLRLLVKKYGS